MRKYVFVACACLMFLSVILTGCEVLEEKNYITVTMQAYVSVSIHHCVNPDPSIAFHDVYTPSAWAGVTVRFTFTKADGENKIIERTSGTNGWTSASATFKVYKEQPVEVYVHLEGLSKSEGSVKIGDFREWDWETIWASAGEKMGGSCTFTQDFELFKEVFD